MSWWERWQSTPTDESSALLDAASRKFDVELDLRMRKSARKISKLEAKAATFPATLPGVRPREAHQLILGDIQMLKNVEDNMLKSACLVHKLDGAAKMSITKIQAVVAANEVSQISSNTQQPPGNSLQNAMRDHANNARMDGIISKIETVSTLDDDEDNDDNDAGNDMAVAVLQAGLPSIPSYSIRKHRLPNNHVAA
jgi:hypothetical protein